MLKCPNCQAENSDGVDTCFLCGQTLKRSRWSKIRGGFGGKKFTDVTPQDTVTYTDAAEEIPEPQQPPEPRRDSHDDAERLKNQGRDHLQRGDFHRAIEASSEAIRINPEFADAYYNRGLAYHNLGQYQKAIEDLSEASRLNPQDADAYLTRGFAYFYRNEAQRAVDDFNEAIELNSQYAEAYAGRAMANTSLMKDDLAEADAQRAIELGIDPSFMDSLEELRSNR